jgi:hypothetical protein
MRVNFALPPDKYATLSDLAQQARRRPSDQAAVMLERALQAEASNQPPSAASFSRTPNTEGGANSG